MSAQMTPRRMMAEMRTKADVVEAIARTKECCDARAIAQDDQLFHELSELLAALRLYIEVRP